MSGSLIELGMVASVLALILTVVAAVLALAGERLARPAYVHVARQALIANFALITLACFTVVWSFVQNDFSVAYVTQNSNTRLPLIFRLTALWGAHEGSLLLWMWFLTIYSALAVIWHWETHPRSMPYVIATLAAVQFGFLSLIVFLSSPFTELIPPPPEGRELNPLLQDPGLIIHPPLLYLGYVGFVVPFAFAIAALVRGTAGAEWVVAVRRWTLFAWLSLTSGIMVGGYWAYYELGWGGYWAWDPVENASLLPWLTGTALLHSVMAQEKRNLFRGWNTSLAISTFALSLLGTFLVRSGVLTSVHSFAVDPWRGMYLLVFLAVVTLGGFGLLIARVDTLRTAAKLDGTLSREAALLFNNVFFIVTAATVLVGTLYPLAVEVFTGVKLTIAAPYFNTVVLPIFVAIVILMSLGPVIPWRKANGKQIIGFLKVPAAIAAGLVVLAGIFGIRGVVPLAAVAGMVLVISSIGADVGRAVVNRSAVSGKSYLSSLLWLALWNRRRYGGLVVHIGVVIVAFGILASGLFVETKTVALGPNDRFEVGGYTLTFKGLQTVDGPNWVARQADIEVHDGDKSLGLIHPQRRNYPRSDMVTTESAIRTTFAGDLYVVIGDELGEGRASIRGYYFPLIIWIWVGWLVIIAGSLFSMSQRREKARIASPAAREEAVRS